VILVVDASVAIKWFVRETRHLEALRLLDHPADLHAPDLLVAEVTNIAWRKARLGEIGNAQAEDIARAIHRGTPLLYPSALFNERALDLAFRLDHPVCDCLYLACAEALGGRLITADDKFRSTGVKAGFADRFQSLAA
jgi:predicted nucleic acid-binding protein